MTSVDVRVGFVVGVSIVVAAAAANATFEITSAIQAELDRQKKVIAGWAADPVIVKAVADQNAKGPLPGMDNATWKALRRSDPVVRAFQSNRTGKFLQAKIEPILRPLHHLPPRSAAGQQGVVLDKGTRL